MSEPLLDVRDLRVRFGAAEVLHGVDVAVAPGELVALVGESGSGKSVTALAALGLLPAKAVVTGSVRFDGEELLGLDREALRAVRGARVGMVFQEPMTSLTPVLSIGRQMTEALEAHAGAGRDAARAEAVRMLDAVGIPGARARLAQYPHEFSGGMRQRVMLAMTMALGPRLLLADEPTTALDVTVQAQVLDLMKALSRERGTALLLITHDMGVVAETASRTVVMRRGRVVEDAPTERLFAAPGEAYTRELLAAVPRIDGAAPAAPGPKPPALELDDIVVSFAGRGGFGRRWRVRALDGVSLDVRPGETLALVGESGSGKSTLGRVAARLQDADAGRVRVDGEPIDGLRGAALRTFRRRVQMVFQDPFASLDPRRRVGDTIAEPLVIAGASRKEARARALDWLDEVGLPASAATRYPHAFSGGQRQRIAIARAMVCSPRVLIADEPTSALDVSVQERVLTLLEDLRARHDVACLFITHDLAVARRIAHRVAVLHRGRLVEIGPTDEVVGAPRHPYTRALLDAVPVPDPSRGARERAPSPDLRGEPGELVAVAPGHLVRGAAA